MIQKAVQTAVLLCCVVAFCNAKNSETCSSPPKHYSELKCKPIIDDGHNCPNRYECPIFADRDDQKCYFNGHVYDVGTSLSEADQELIPCSPDCQCRSNTSPSSFVCAQIDCPEFFVREESCIYQYNRRGCCASNEICDKEVEKLAECYFEGERYREGQKMYPKGESCYSCYCQKGFDNSTIVGNPNCYEINCGIEVHHSGKLTDGCIPIYFENDKCCPISWRCPKDNDSVIAESSDVAPANPKMQCSFGKLKLNIGESISADDKCVSCKCTIPPMPHCIMAKVC